MSINCNYFLTHQFKHVIWVLKRTVSLEIKKIIFQYTHLSGALQRVEDHTYCVSDDPAPDTCTPLDNVNGTCCNTTGCQYVTCNKTDAPANVTSGLS